MMNAGFASLLGLFGLTSAFALIGLILAAWMAWRIVEKAGLPGWTGLGAVMLTLTAVGTVVPLVLLWIFAFMRWPRDEATGAGTSKAGQPRVLPRPTKRLADARGWRLAGSAAGGGVSLAIDGSSPSWLLTGAPATQANELSVPDPSVGQPHARLLMAGTRLGLEDLGSAGGTFIDGARLLPEHGPRDITASRTIRLGQVELALSSA